MGRHCGILSLLPLFAAAAFGQMLTSSSFSTGPDKSFQAAVTFQTPMLVPHPIVGAPYYGEHISEDVQTLANGAHITRSSQYQRTWRDSQGRTRTERLVAKTSLPDVPPLIQITDPVAGYFYALDAGKKVVHRVALTLPGGAQSVNSAPMSNGAAPRTGAAGSGSAAIAVAGSAIERKSEAPRPQISQEALGTKTLDGIVVEGSRTTTVYPIGSANNDAPFSTTVETWRSPDLSLVLLMTNDDPSTGVIASKIVNLNTQEPDPALFVPPPDYTIVDETGSFTITWGAQ
jgi:hypothetical protein